MTFSPFAIPPLDPGAQRVLELMRAAARPPFETLSPDEARFFYNAGRTLLQPDPEDVAATRDLAAPGPNGAIPLPQPPLAPELLGLVAHVAAYERLAVAAAVTGSRAIARRALLAHPLVGQWGVIEPLLDGLLGAPAGARP